MCKNTISSRENPFIFSVFFDIAFIISKCSPICMLKRVNAQHADSIYRSCAKLIGADISISAKISLDMMIPLINEMTMITYRDISMIVMNMRDLVCHPFIPSYIQKMMSDDQHEHQDRHQKIDDHLYCTFKYHVSTSFYSASISSHTIDI